MYYEAACKLFKTIAPILLFFGILFEAWSLGANHVQHKFDQYKAEVKVQSEKLTELAKIHNEEVNRKLTESAKIIGDTYERNMQTNNVFLDRNHSLLDDRVWNDSGGNKNRMPKTNTATSGGDETASAYWVISEQTGRDFIAEAARADEIVETARSCQAYINSIPEEFFTQEGTQ